MGVLFQDGWYVFSQKGSHRQLKHLEKIGRVTVPNPKTNVIGVEI
ncbi:type II toxin-antitoxin system HicA family toxin [Leptospira bourretii]|nr:type II toxin-antitoxin system HicA family toxin [Leptospira bourretii]